MTEIASVGASERLIVVDTSALLVSGTRLLSFIEGSTVVIPHVVLKELEGKRADPKIGWLARQWLNLIEEGVSVSGAEFTGLAEFQVFRTHEGDESFEASYEDFDDELWSEDAPVPTTIVIQSNHSNQKSLPSHLVDGSVDSTVLAVAYNLSHTLENEFDEADSDLLEVYEGFMPEQLLLLSNDTPMRISAMLDLGISAYSYSDLEFGRIEPYYGTVSLVSDFPMDEVFQVLDDGVSGARNSTQDERVFGEEVPQWALADIRFPLDGSMENVLMEPRVMTPVSHSELSRKLDRSVLGITPRTIEQKVALYYMRKPADELPIVSVSGTAGTGKTLLTIASGLEQVEQGIYDSVLVLKSLHEMGIGQELGFLPGEFEDKMAPWKGAIEDAIKVIKKSSRKMPADWKRKVEVSPITYLRGRSLTRTFIVIEEAQNFSRSELLNIISRAGEGSKIVLTWDPYQVDNRFLESGDKSDVYALVDRMKSEPLFAHMTLRKTQRSKVAELAGTILAE